MPDDDFFDELESELDQSFHTPEDLEAGELYRLWPLRTLRDAYQDREPRRFLVEDLLPCPSLSIVYGAPGSLKSMILCDLAACVAAGHPWLETLPSSDPPLHTRTFQTQQSGVLWIDYDNGVRRTDERFDAMGKSRNLPESTPITYASMPRPWLDGSNTTMIDELKRLVTRLDASLVVIDNLGLVSGDVEENSAEMTKVMGNFRYLADSSDIAVILIHHQRKTSATTNGVRKGETLRGHSSIEAALDYALVVERKPGTDQVALIPTKVRDGQSSDAIGAMFTYQHRDGTKELETSRFWAWSAGSKDEMENIGVIAMIKQVLREHPHCCSKDVVDGVRDAMAARPGGKAPGINKIRGLLKSLVDDGIIFDEGHGRERVYFLP